MDANEIKDKLLELFGTCFIIEGLEPTSVAIKILEAGLASGCLTELGKISKTTTQAIVSGEAWVASMKYVFPPMLEGGILSRLKPLQKKLMIPDIYIADEHWVVSKYVERASYRENNESFILGTFSVLHTMDELAETDLVNISLAAMRNFFSNEYLELIVDWLVKQSAFLRRYPIDVNACIDALDRFELIEEEYIAIPLKLSHGDFQPANIIRDKAERYWIVDWDDCRYRPRGFDIAWLIQSMVLVNRLREKEALIYWDKYNQNDGLPIREHLMNRTVAAVKFLANASGIPEQLAVFRRSLVSLKHLLRELAV